MIIVATAGCPSTTSSRLRLLLPLCIVVVLCFLRNEYNNLLLISTRELDSSSFWWMPTVMTTSIDTSRLSRNLVSNSMYNIIGGGGGGGEGEEQPKPSHMEEGEQPRAADSTTLTITITMTTKDYSNQSIYWRYDEAAPPIRYAKTHQLQSIPIENRLTLSAIDNITEYVLQPQNQYPQKLHMFETNPSIAILPRRYQVYFNGSDGSIPRYIASYRGITHNNNCFRQFERLQMHGGGDWNTIKKIPDPGYLGLALLSEDLSILADTVVVVKTKGLEGKYKFSDYRLFNIHDELYLSTGITIGRLQLGLPPPSYTGIVDGSGSDTDRMVPPPPPPLASGDKKDYIQLKHFDIDQRFEVYLHTKPSCPECNSMVENEAKNLLYFVDSNNQTMVEYWPMGNPNQVQSINYTKKCKQYRGKNVKTKKHSHGANVSFHNFHEKQYPGRKDLFMSDRGSACCVRMKNPWTNQEYLVGVVHPKTPFPGKRLPRGVTKNNYLSRFFAMETFPPYNIVVRTGSFCFGYSKDDELHGTTLWNNPEYQQMTMANKTFDCPRIHFIMSMIDNIANPGQVIISYGVSDCTSRFIVVDKVDIQAMLWPSPPLEPPGDTNLASS